MSKRLEITKLRGVTWRDTRRPPVPRLPKPRSAILSFLIWM